MVKQVFLTARASELEVVMVAEMARTLGVTKSALIRYALARLQKELSDAKVERAEKGNGRAD